jgi:phospholipase C
MPIPRRDFMKYAALLSGAGVMGAFPDSVKRAMAIEPEPGSSFLDAEHVVILMQENRSFDHTFGTLRGVRGFGDPRAIPLPDGCPVWAQQDRAGKRFLPFRLNIKDTRSTWMGCLPHSWGDQVDARNNGRYDRWLHVKGSGEKAFAGMPLTLGYYTREDIPFYYALADAFTVCDQNFCSCLTGTTPNRLHLWSGTIRATPSADAFPCLLNQDADYGNWVNWTTFPERLEDLGVPWRIYQNELTIESGLEPDHESWLANFGDNPIEYFAQFGVRFAPAHHAFVLKRLSEIPGELADLNAQAEKAPEDKLPAIKKRIASLERTHARYQAERTEFSRERFEALPERTRRLHERAFTINSADPDFRELEELTYRDGDRERRMKVPKGDMLHQFRKDVAEGKLPAVSWLVPSQQFSDHPDSAWYGAWYLSEVLDILTKNPEVWKKTIFILTYDENDGYFDHVPPFVAPDPADPSSGRVSGGIDAGLEFIPLESDRRWHPSQPRNSSIGLGYRVPMVIASPWSRGGAVCSEVFDHTSVLRFLETFLSRKTGSRVHEPNINRWRRTVCGDLTSAFRAADNSAPKLQPLEREQFLAQIHRAQFAEIPSGFRELGESEVGSLRRDAARSPLLPSQEPGTRPSCPLPYELFASLTLNDARDELILKLEARNALFGERAAGSPFTAYANAGPGAFACRNYAVEPGHSVEDRWKLADFADGQYRIRVHGPNGFLWEFTGDANDPRLDVQLAAPPRGAQTADAEVVIRSREDREHRLSLRDLSYGNPPSNATVPASGSVQTRISTSTSHRWYDFTVATGGPFSRRFAGRLETGAWSQSDPAIGRRA